MRHLIQTVLALAAAGLVFACEEKPSPPTPATKSTSPPAATVTRIAVVPKGTTHDFWKSIEAGANKAARELSTPEAKIEVKFQGPEKEDDREQQVALVQNLISGKYNAIVLAPLDDKALVAPVKQATEAGIPVIIIDSGLDAQVGRDFVSFVATDNERGGQLAGEKMAALLGNKGKVLMLRYQEGSASTALREKGFADAVTKVPGVTLIDPHRYAGATRATAQEAAENLLIANSDIQGVFCPNESSTYGMLLALRGRDMAGKVKFVGFDASDAAVDAMRKGELDGLILQNPVRMGYLGVKTAVDHIRGKPVEPRIDTGVGLITRELMDTPEAKELLSPDLSGLGSGGR